MDGICSKLNAFLKDERQGFTEYYEMAEFSDLTPDEKARFKKMAKDEMSHENEILAMMKKHGCKVR